MLNFQIIHAISKKYYVIKPRVFSSGFYDSKTLYGCLLNDSNTLSPGLQIYTSFPSGEIQKLLGLVVAIESVAGVRAANNPVLVLIENIDTLFPPLLAVYIFNPSGEIVGYCGEEPVAIDAGTVPCNGDNSPNKLLTKLTNELIAFAASVPIKGMIIPSN
jgi:hypothetical protein